MFNGVIPLSSVVASFSRRSSIHSPWERGCNRSAGKMRQARWSAAFGHASSNSSPRTKPRRNACVQNWGVGSSAFSSDDCWVWPGPWRGSLELPPFARRRALLCGKGGPGAPEAGPASSESRSGLLSRGAVPTKFGSWPTGYLFGKRRGNGERLDPLSIRIAGRQGKRGRAIFGVHLGQNRFPILGPPLTIAYRSVPLILSSLRGALKSHDCKG